MPGVQLHNLLHTAKDWKLHFASLQIDESEVQTLQLTGPRRNDILD